MKPVRDREQTPLAKRNYSKQPLRAHRQQRQKLNSVYKNGSLLSVANNRKLRNSRHKRHLDLVRKGYRKFSDYAVLIGRKINSVIRNTRQSLALHVVRNSKAVNDG